MPGGSAARKLDNESQQKVAGSLATDKAKKRGGLRIVDDDFEPYPDELASGLTTPEEAGADDNFEPGGGNPEEDIGAPKTGGTKEQNTDAQPQKYLGPEQQDIVGTSMAAKKQDQLTNDKKYLSYLQKQLAELEKNLTTFKDSKHGRLLSFFRPQVMMLIKMLIEDLKKGMKNLSEKQQVGYLSKLITTASSLIGMLTAAKMPFAVIDATFSWLKKAVPSAVTCIGCILFIIIAALYIPFMALIYMLGTIPLLKGKLTKMDADMIKELKEQKAAWQAVLDPLQKKVAIRNQIKFYKNRINQLQREGVRTKLTKLNAPPK